MTTHKMTNNLVDVKIILSALWVARMLTGFVGDVLKFYEPGMAAQIAAGAVDGMALTPGFLVAAAIIFVMPVFMAYLSLILPYKANRWANIIVAAHLRIRIPDISGHCRNGVPCSHCPDGLEMEQVWNQLKGWAQ